MDFIRKEERYTATWKNPVEFEFGEVTLLLPDMPEERLMKNYNKATLDQKYEREVVPKDVATWGFNDLDALAASQWHRRLNGEWVLIKGDPYYIPGPGCVFFDFWTKKTGGRPDFRLSTLELSWFWTLYVEPDPKLYGVYDMKPRRIGDTEWWLFQAWECCTRRFGQKGGLQSFTDDEAKKNFNRLTKGAKGMPYFFKPKRSGKDTNYLSYQSPSELITMKKFEEKLDKIEVNNDDELFLGSYIDSESTVTGKYDGDQLTFYFLDEIFKIFPHKMDVKVQWENIKRVMSLFASTKIIGKAVLCSTVEEKNEKDNPDYVQTVELARHFWEKSDPNKRDENGETYTGLARIFRSFRLAAEPDEWGFPKSMDAETHRANRLKKFFAAEDFAAITNIYRKEPGTAEEALTDFSAACPINPALMQMRAHQIREGLDINGEPIEDYSPKCREYTLVWKGGVPFTEVEAIPKKGGFWHISQMPVKPNNVGFVNLRGETYYKPLNTARYSAGCDPIDAANPLAKGSDFAMVLKRSLYPPDEVEEIMYDEKTGDPKNPENMITNRYVCDYKGRPKNPYDAYMDGFKTLWFFGSACLIEIDKPGFEAWLLDNNLHYFMSLEPKHTMASSRRKQRQNTKSSKPVINRYIDLLINYTSKYWMNIDHPRILDQYARFTEAKRTHFDLGVAGGFCELMDDDKNVKLVTESVESGWDESIFEEANV